MRRKEIYIKEKTDIENRIERYITENVIEILQAYGVNQIGIAVPGTVTDKKIIKAVNLGIVDYDLGNILEQNLLNLGYYLASFSNQSQFFVVGLISQFQK